MTDLMPIKQYDYHFSGGDPHEYKIDENGESFPESNVIPLAPWECFHGPMQCTRCFIVITVVIPLKNKREADKIFHWDGGGQGSPFPNSLNGEKCPNCLRKTLRYCHIEGYYDADSI